MVIIVLPEPPFKAETKKPGQPVLLALFIFYGPKTQLLDIAMLNPANSNTQLFNHAQRTIRKITKHIDTVV
jgi:hypothetical protein